MMGRGALAAAVAVFAAGRGASASCAFRFEGHLNISELPTWTIPATGASGSGYRVLNDEYPLVFLGEWDCCVSVVAEAGAVGRIPLFALLIDPTTARLKSERT